MNISIEKPDALTDYLITIKCKEIPHELVQVLNSLETEKHLVGYVDDTMHRINLDDIYYIESVDKKIFLYGEQLVLYSKQKLYELEDELKYYDFLRISKTTIINLKKIKTVTPISSGKLEAALLNDDKIIISRQYTSVMKKYLGLH